MRGQVDCAISGITLAAAFLRGDELYVGNAGDCRAVIGRLKGKRGSGVYDAIDLTVDHRPDRPDEKNRIEKCGGRVEPVKLQNHDEYVGPMRVWKGKSNVPGLNVSRSLGDIIAHSAGVSSQPEFTHTQLDKKDEFLILATDGVWEWTSSQARLLSVPLSLSLCPLVLCLCRCRSLSLPLTVTHSLSVTLTPSQEAVDIVAQGDDAESACEQLVREAYTRWELNGEGIADDTTAIVVFFDEDDGNDGSTPVAVLEDGAVGDDGYDD